MASKKSRARKRSNPEKKKSPLEKKETKLAITFLVLIAVIAIAAILITSGTNNTSSDENDDNGTTYDTDNPVAIIDTTMGTIMVELYQDLVPNTVNNFITLANDGFYDGLVFHRVINNFMIQGGGFYPNGQQKQSTYGSIDLEINPEVKHVDGAIAMARTNDPNSATSQFFIDDGAQPSLEPGGVDPNGYAAFGVTIEGLDVVRAIAALSPDQTTTKYGMSDWPIDDVIINSITIENQ